MTLRAEMDAAARRGASRLGDAAPRSAATLHSLAGPRGGFRGRADTDDLYYTAFGVGCAQALGADLPPELPAYLDSFGDGEGLDLVHLACLARCRAVAAPADEPTRLAMVERLAAIRTPDGGFAMQRGAVRGSGAAAFFAVGAYEDLGAELPQPRRLLDALAELRTADGAFADEPAGHAGSTPVTAGVAVLLRHFGRPVGQEVERWLLARLDAAGGFRAGPRAPLPDMVSTATALYALSGRAERIAPIRQACLRFLDELWDEQAGGFRGHVLDADIDCEHTWYALTALGHLGE